jgi:S1-C subfamily serine protease
MSERRDQRPPVSAEEGHAFTEEELEELFREADEEEEPQRPIIGAPWFRKTVLTVLAVLLCAQVLAFWPRIYSLPAIEFLRVSARLSQSDEIRAYKESVVVVRTDDAKGTGFIISEDGLVVTNRHVIEGARRPVVSLPNGDTYIAKAAVIGTEADLAILDLDAQNLPALPLAERYNGEAGTPIYVIGNPLFFNGIANEGETIGLLGRFHPPAIGLQAPIYKGNSGSPVIDRSGEVIGVVYAIGTIARNGGGEQKVGLAVPIERVIELLDAAGLSLQVSPSDHRAEPQG